MNTRAYRQAGVQARCSYILTTKKSMQYTAIEEWPEGKDTLQINKQAGVGGVFILDRNKMINDAKSKMQVFFLFIFLWWENRNNEPLIFY